MIKLQIQAGAANPAPPVGPALGQHGVKIMEFCKVYNAAMDRTAERAGFNPEADSRDVLRARVPGEWVR